jgi:hypothetical protein
VYNPSQSTTAVANSQGTTNITLGSTTFNGSYYLDTVWIDELNPIYGYSIFVYTSTGYFMEAVGIMGLAPNSPYVPLLE